MAYVEENLMPGETIIVKAKLHWGLFLAPATFIVIGGLLMLPFLLGVATLPSQDRQAAASAVSASMCCLLPYLVICGALVASAVSRYLTTEFALTDRRIIAKTGLVRRVSLELLLQKVESIGVSQPLMGRLLN